MNLPSSYAVRQAMVAFSDSVKETWSELISPKRTAMRTKVGGSADESGSTGGGRGPSAREWKGSTELRTVEKGESAWDRMQARLASAPIIEDVLRAAGKVAGNSGVKKLRDTVTDIKSVMVVP